MVYGIFGALRNFFSAFLRIFSLITREHWLEWGYEEEVNIPSRVGLPRHTVNPDVHRRHFTLLKEKKVKTNFTHKLGTHVRKWRGQNRTSIENFKPANRRNFFFQIKGSPENSLSLGARTKLPNFGTEKSPKNSLLLSLIHISEPTRPY